MRVVAWRAGILRMSLLCGGQLTRPEPPFARARARRRQWAMTNPRTSPDELPLPRARSALTVGDAERIATAIDAELAPSTPAMYAHRWPPWRSEGRRVGKRVAGRED